MRPLFQGLKIINTMKHILYTPLFLIALTSCAYVPNAQPQMVAEPDTVDLMLADAADRSSRALETLSAMERTQIPTDTTAIVPDAPAELQRAVTFNWTGPVEPLVEELARKSGYTYGTIGSEPNTPILMTMSATNEPLINVFRNIGVQMGARGDLKVDAAARMIEIEYTDFANNRNDQ